MSFAKFDPLMIIVWSLIFNNKEQFLCLLMLIPGTRDALIQPSFMINIITPLRLQLWKSWDTVRLYTSQS